MGNNIGGIEFFLIDNKPCFIELNPMWGGAAGRGGFGNEEMKKYINTNKDKLYNKISNMMTVPAKTGWISNFLKIT